MNVMNRKSRRTVTCYLSFPILLAESQQVGLNRDNHFPLENRPQIDSRVVTDEGLRYTRREICEPVPALAPVHRKTPKFWCLRSLRPRSLEIRTDGTLF